MQLPCSTRWPTATAEIRNAINRVPGNMVVICEETLKKCQGRKREFDEVNIDLAYETAPSAEQR
jgi:hypothetical protein